MLERILRWVIPRLLRKLSDIEKEKAEDQLGAARSPGWTRVRNAYLKEHPKCEVTGSTEDTEVHHVRPFHLHPELELDPANFITLRRDMHFLFGHLMNWASSNSSVREDVKFWREKILKRP